MARILRGDIVWANLNPTKGHEQSGTRPVVILSHTIFNERSGTVIAVALSSRPQKVSFPLAIELSNKIAKKKAWVKISQVRLLSKARLTKKIGQITNDELKLIISGLNEIIA